MSDRPVEAWLAEHREGLVAIRRHIHAHPELSGEEFATTELVAERLELAGIASRRLSSGSGIVGDLDPPGLGEVPDGTRLALRADIDALAMQDEKDVPYRSQVPGVAHACGHDVHTAMVLGTALYFAHHLDELPGPLRFVFQPAEERVPGGALDVLAEGGLDGVGAALGVHCDPKSDVGTVGLKAGAVSSAADMALITLVGPGGHTARPELTVDMITLAGRLVTDLPRRVATALGEPDGVRVVFGAIRSGDAANVIPSHCELRASVRTPSVDLWERLPRAFDEALCDLLHGSGASHELDYTHGVPPVVNDEAMVEVVRRAAVAEFGPEVVGAAVQSWGGDDFAWLAREVPAAFMRLGVHDPADPGPRLDLHAGHFDVDERVIPFG
ncbi:MAG: amidohydrolase, partial [Actinobacteria bacterium]|nr:amidohydrolase [Actinomycetota bacterium]NIT96687.1 amidohydrolase [Actinomycetota bacterium]NIU20380.1 amidohydrolase [Actinomycetota bacterium]NIV88403.1 amidohydrolase [Actinomycetota bacterium]NIW29871.1 amidohydrolase [Actinomycetota bacterium]